MSINNKIQDQVIEHQADLQKLISGITPSIISILNYGTMSNPGLRRKVYDLVKKIDPGSYKYPKTRDKKVQQLLSEIKSISKSQFSKFQKTLTDQISSKSKKEVIWNKQLFDSIFKVEIWNSLSEQQLEEILKNLTFQGMTLDQWVQKLNYDFDFRTRSTIQQTYYTDPTASYSKVNTALGSSVFPLTLRNSDSLSRTFFNRAFSRINEEILKQNQDLLRGFQWVATLDGRTCPICAVLDGRVWDTDNDPISPNQKQFPGSPPIHFNCRCTLVPVVLPFEEISNKKIKDIPPSTRASMDGQVPETMNFEQWLKSKPEEFQKSWFPSEKKYQVWKSGQLTLNQIVDSGIGKPLTDKQIDEKLQTSKD